MIKDKMFGILDTAEKILQNQKYAIKNDPDYPMKCDIKNISLAKSLLGEAELLLLKDESKQPQPPDFANTTLGEVPPVVSAENQESSKAVEGATPVVRQNEQTKEVCPLCKTIVHPVLGATCLLDGCPGMK